MTRKGQKPMDINGNGMEYAVGEYSVKLKKIVDEFRLEIIYAPEGWEKIEIKSSDVSLRDLRSEAFSIASIISASSSSEMRNLSISVMRRALKGSRSSMRSLQGRYRL